MSTKTFLSIYASGKVQLAFKRDHLPGLYSTYDLSKYQARIGGQSLIEAVMSITYGQEFEIRMLEVLAGEDKVTTIVFENKKNKEEWALSLMDGGNGE